MPEQPEQNSGAKKWNLIIDVANGVHANSAVIATKDEYVGNDYPGYAAPLPEEGGDIMWVERKVRGQTPINDSAYLLRTCNHCDNGPCQKVGGDAVQKREDGIVIIDPVKAKGKKEIADACPFGAVIWNEELQLPQHWIFDAHLLDQGWSHPRCVDVCPVGAIEAVKITDEEMQARVAAEGLEVLRPELKTKPRVYYRNMYRFNKCFVGGTVLANQGGVMENAENATVKLMKDGAEIGTTTTDEYGEFKIDKLEPDSGAYSVDIQHPELGQASAQFELSDSLNVGEIVLT
ncbi:MAG: 4Fe-4S dicluster domain-containing protein [Pseudomonadota bacterium]